MNNRRRLTLKRESLTELTTDQLGAVVGGVTGDCEPREVTSLIVQCGRESSPVAYCLTLAGPRCIF